MKQGQTVLSPDHEYITLVHEEALNRGFDVDSGPDPDSGGYYAEIYHCTLRQLAALLGAVEDKRTNPQLSLALEAAQAA